MQIHFNVINILCKCLFSCVSYPTDSLRIISFKCFFYNNVFGIVQFFKLMT